MSARVRAAENDTSAGAIQTVLDNAADLKAAIRKGVPPAGLDLFLMAVELSAAHARKVCSK